jgi:hypothetical protein
MLRWSFWELLVRRPLIAIAIVLRLLPLFFGRANVELAKFPLASAAESPAANPRAAEPGGPFKVSSKQET